MIFLNIYVVGLESILLYRMPPRTVSYKNK